MVPPSTTRPRHAPPAAEPRQLRRLHVPRGRLLPRLRRPLLPLLLPAPADRGSSEPARSGRRPLQRLKPRVTRWRERRFERFPASRPALREARCGAPSLLPASPAVRLSRQARRCSRPDRYPVPEKQPSRFLPLFFLLLFHPRTGAAWLPSVQWCKPRWRLGDWAVVLRSGADRKLRRPTIERIREALPRSIGPASLCYAEFARAEKFPQILVYHAAVLVSSAACGQGVGKRSAGTKRDTHFRRCAGIFFPNRAADAGDAASGCPRSA